MTLQNPRFFVTGTDTDVGKTVAAAWLMLQLDGTYWKPVQSGIDGMTDETVIRTLTGLPDGRFTPPTYTLTQPLSPHESARRDDVRIDMDSFRLPATDRPLIVEGAGGLMVPLNEKQFVIDLIAHLDIPAILVTRSGLGTINHTLLSLKALKDKNIPVAGLIINGPLTPHNRQALEEYGNVRIIAEIPRLDVISKETLLAIKPEFDVLERKKVA
jgi:dethiobiotin synthase